MSRILMVDSEPTMFDLVAIADAAEIIGRSTARVRQLVDAGRLPVAARVAKLRIRLFSRRACLQLRQELDTKRAARVARTGRRRSPR